MLNRIICWFVGHDVEAFESSVAADADIRWYSFRCRRCKKRWIREFGFTHSLLAVDWKMNLVDLLDEKCRDLARG